MKKVKNIPVPNKNYFAWEYQEQTKIKHQVLQKYLGVWFVILSKYSNVNYFDCFGGCGAYTSDRINFEPGSPILASQAWQNTKKTNSGLSIFCFDTDKDTLDNLEKVYADYCPNFNKATFINNDYDESINLLLDELDKENITIAPSFFFIDPFGHSLKYSTITRIIQLPQSEVFLNFMYNSVTRYLRLENLECNYNELFGCDDWKTIKNLKGIQRENHIVDLYRIQLKKVSKFVMPYRICFPDKKRTYYYLYHLSNHKKGASTMKDCFASLNEGRIEYLGKTQDQLSVFDLQELKEEKIKKFLLDSYSMQTVSFDKIISDNIDATPFLEKEFRKVLKQMKKDGIVSVRNVTSKTDKGLKERDQVSFLR